MSTGLAGRVGDAERWLARHRALVGCVAGLWLLTTATRHFVVAPASVLPSVAADLGVSEGRAVWLVSAAPASWAATNAVLGLRLDRAGDYRAVAAGVAVVVLADGASRAAATRGSSVALLTARLVAGVAVGLVWTASTNLIGGAVSPAVRGTALGVFLTSAPAGFALGQATGPIVAARAGWPAGLLVMPAGSVVAFGLVAGFAVQLTFGVVHSYVREAVDDGVTGTALSVLTTAGISGAFSAPLATGALIELSGGYGPAFGYAGLLVALGLAASWGAPESTVGAGRTPACEGTDSPRRATGIDSRRFGSSCRGSRVSTTARADRSPPDLWPPRRDVTRERRRTTPPRVRVARPALAGGVPRPARGRDGAAGCLGPPRRLRPRDLPVCRL